MTNQLSSAEKKVFWEKHINAQIKSKRGRKEYCLKYSLNLSQFNYWKDKLFKARGKSAQKSPPVKPKTSNFTPVKVTPSVSSSNLVIQLSSGAQLSGIDDSNYSLALKLIGELS